MQAAVVGNGASLIEVQIRVAAEVVKREAVDVQFLRRGVVDDQISLGVEWEILDFIELINTNVAPKALAVFDDLSGKIRADAWDGLQLGSIGSIKDDVLSLTNLRLVMGHQRIVLSIGKAMPPLIGRVEINDFGADIDRSLTNRLLKRTVAMMLRCRKSIDGIGKNEIIRVVATSAGQEDDDERNDHHHEQRKDGLAIRLLQIEERTDHITPN